MAKCKYFYDRQACLVTHKTGCPKNTTGDCDIKPPRYKRIKAWAWWNHWDNVYVANSGCNKPNYKRDRVVAIPCTILIEAKYLKGDK